MIWNVFNLNGISLELGSNLGFDDLTHAHENLNGRSIESTPEKSFQVNIGWLAGWFDYGEIFLNCK